MLIGFTKKDGVLDDEKFLDYEVQFNIFHRIIEGKEVLALKTEDGNVVAMCNPGYGMWIWINESIEEPQLSKIINEICHVMKENNMPGISGEPNMIKRIAEEYSSTFEVAYEITMGMQSYRCVEVVKPSGVQGQLKKAQLSDLDITAEYCACFSSDSSGKMVTKESQMLTAQNMINSGNLFLWIANNEVVSMAYIVHRSSRYARINSVYTDEGHRRNGYASALMAELSSRILHEGLIPMLYTDIKNPDSNKVYKSIGYKECGRIDEIVFSSK